MSNLGMLVEDKLEKRRMTSPACFMLSFRRWIVVAFELLPGPSM